MKGLKQYVAEREGDGKRLKCNEIVAPEEDQRKNIGIKKPPNLENRKVLTGASQS